MMALLMAMIAGALCLGASWVIDDPRACRQAAAYQCAGVLGNIKRRRLPSSSCYGATERWAKPRWPHVAARNRRHSRRRSAFAARRFIAPIIGPASRSSLRSDRLRRRDGRRLK